MKPVPPRAGWCQRLAGQVFKRASPHTIKSRMKPVYRKLGVSSRHQAVIRARAVGLVEG